MNDNKATEVKKDVKNNEIGRNPGQVERVNDTFPSRGIDPHKGETPEQKKAREENEKARGEQDRKAVNL